MALRSVPKRFGFAAFAESSSFAAGGNGHALGFRKGAIAHGKAAQREDGISRASPRPAGYRRLWIPVQQAAQVHGQPPAAFHGIGVSLELASSCASLKRAGGWSAGCTDDLRQLAAVELVLTQVG